MPESNEGRKGGARGEGLAGTQRTGFGHRGRPA